MFSYELTRCVVCGHADADLLADADEILAEQEALWAYHGRRLRPTTPPRRLMGRVAFSEPPPLAVVQCRDCGLVYRNPIERAHELHEIYAAEETPSDTLASLHATQRTAMSGQAKRLRDALGRG